MLPGTRYNSIRLVHDCARFRTAVDIHVQCHVDLQRSSMAYARTRALTYCRCVYMYVYMLQHGLQLIRSTRACTSTGGHSSTAMMPAPATRFRRATVAVGLIRARRGHVCIAQMENWAMGDCPRMDRRRGRGFRVLTGH